MQQQSIIFACCLQLEELKELTLSIPHSQFHFRVVVFFIYVSLSSTMTVSLSQLVRNSKTIGNSIEINKWKSKGHCSIVD